MKVEKTFGELHYLGQMVSRIKTYYVFRGDDHYLVVSYSAPHTGNFSIVASEAVNFVQDHFAGKKGITKHDIEDHPAKAKYIKGTFDILNIFYVLVATKQASIDRSLSKGATVPLHFNIRPKKKKKKKKNRQ
ncbi:MAG: hypothetical protein M1482_08475 [Chloroflexi bacterium]|nr:hypothetical protein [Chloroflexota bacterium]